MLDVLRPVSEALPTLAALMGPLRCWSGTGTPKKALATIGALTGSFTGAGQQPPALVGGQEALTAISALAGLLGAGVDALVPLQVGTLGETLPAIPATVGFLTHMDTPMPVKMGAPGKALTTITALVGFAGSMAPLMLQQRGVQAKTLPTLPTLVGLLAGMSAPVLGQRRALGEALPAFTALQGLLGGFGAFSAARSWTATAIGTTASGFASDSVGTAMPVEVGAPAEAFTTFGAGVGLFTGVDPAMPLQM